jgi:hypothetical protein
MLLTDGNVQPGHVACIGETRNGYKISVRKPEGKSPFGISHVDGNILSKRILTDRRKSVWIRLRTTGGPLGKAPWGFRKGGAKRLGVAITF